MAVLGSSRSRQLGKSKRKAMQLTPRHASRPVFSLFVEHGVDHQGDVQIIATPGDLKGRSDAELRFRYSRHFALSVARTTKERPADSLKLIGGVGGVSRVASAGGAG